MSHQNHWHDLGDGPHIVWWVEVDNDAVNRWHGAAGQDDIDAWCRAHGWNPNDVLRDSVLVTALSDGRVEVLANLIARDGDGKPMFRDDEIATTPVVAAYARSLPEGVAPVRRP